MAKLQPHTLEKVRKLHERIKAWKFIYPNQDFSVYQGPVDRKKMSRLARYAYESFNCQKKKCNNPNDRWFKHYGGKGLTVEYSVREYIGWYLHCRKIVKANIYTVSRIDHDKGYNFDNIMMADSSDNSLEAFIRNRVWDQKGAQVPLLGFNKKGKKVIEFESIREAARQLNCSQRLIQFLIRGRYKKSSKVPYILKYKHGSNKKHEPTNNSRSLHSKK